MTADDFHRGHDAIRDAYRNEAVATGYIDQRFREPLGALLHDRQARALRQHVRASQPRRVLEIAPGPARLTVEVAAALERGGVVVDTSAEMLAVARARLQAAGHHGWRLLRGDAFTLPFRGGAGGFDLVYTFRLIRHFEDGDRARLYREIARVLRPGGSLIFDAINERVSSPLRARAKAGEYAHYDALHTPGQLRSELAAAGLTVVRLQGVQRRYGWLSRLQVLVSPRSRPLARGLMEVIDRTGGEALEWIVTCRRA